MVNVVVAANRSSFTHQLYSRVTAPSGITNQLFHVAIIAEAEVRIVVPRAPCQNPLEFHPSLVAPSLPVQNNANSVRQSTWVGRFLQSLTKQRQRFATVLRGGQPPRLRQNSSCGAAIAVLPSNTISTKTLTLLELTPAILKQPYC